MKATKWIAIQKNEYNYIQPAQDPNQGKINASIAGDSFDIIHSLTNNRVGSRAGSRLTISSSRCPLSKVEKYFIDLCNRVGFLRYLNYADSILYGLMK